MKLPDVAHSRRNRSAVVSELRRLLPRMEGAADDGLVLSFGVPALDSYLPKGGLTFGALHEFAPETIGDAPAALGCIAALLTRMPQSGTVVLVASPRGLTGCGRLYGHGLNAVGLDPARVILAEPRDEQLALWAMEEALRSGAPAAVTGVIGTDLDLKSSQRLQLAARTSGLPLLLLRPAGAVGTSAAATRWRIGSAGAARDRFGLIVRRRWRVALERCRNGRSGEWLLEWDHGARRFCLAPAMADPALSRGAGTLPLRRAG